MKETHAPTQLAASSCASTGLCVPPTTQTPLLVLSNRVNRPANIGSAFVWGRSNSGSGSSAGGGKGGDGKGKPSKQASQRKELTEEQKKRLEAIRKVGSS